VSSIKDKGIISPDLQVIFGTAVPI
jgi:hypothetical protein